MTVRISEKEVATLSWGLFLALILSTVFIATGFSAGPLFLIGLAAVVVFSFRYIYLAFFLAVALTPFLGIMISIPTGALRLGERAFGGSIDMSLGEAVLFVVLAAWALRLVLFWRGRGDENWRPRLPLIKSYLCLVGAHLASALSSIAIDPLVSVKYALRPILFNYLAYVALPVNIIRSRWRLVVSLGVVAAVGTLAAANGFISMFFPVDSSQLVGRAHPFPIFGLNMLGDNQNSLADILVVTVLFTLALATLARRDKTRRRLLFAAAFQFAIGLLTFTRTVWIVFILQAVFLGTVLWREEVKKRMSWVMLGLVLILPLAAIMAVYSVSQTAQSSNSTRLALTEIATQVFLTSPLIGGGAGSFVDRVGSSQVFLIEYGAPLDSHGILQKLAAETGSLGLLAYGFVLASLGALFLKGYRLYKKTVAAEAIVLLITGTAGGIIYQFFNTDFWTGKMWLPIGLTLAAFTALKESGPIVPESPDFTKKA